MRVIILAAGLGTRMQPITNDRPKCLVPLCGRPLLNRQIDVLREAGLDNIILVGGYRADRLQGLGLPLVINDDYAVTNMVKTLFCAEEYMQPGEDLIIAYGDIVYELRVLKSLISCNAHLCIAVDRAWREYWEARMENPLDDAETLKLDGFDRIVELGKKAKSYEEIQGQYIGLIKIAGDYVQDFRQAWHQMDRNASYDGKDFNNMYMTSFLQHLINLGWEARAAFTENGWLEVDTLSDLYLYEQMQKEGNLIYFYCI